MNLLICYLLFYLLLKILLGFVVSFLIKHDRKVKLIILCLHMYEISFISGWILYDSIFRKFCGILRNCLKLSDCTHSIKVKSALTEIILWFRQPSFAPSIVKWIHPGIKLQSVGFLWLIEANWPYTETKSFWAGDNLNLTKTYL